MKRLEARATTPPAERQGVHVRIDPDVMAQRVEHELVIVHLRTNQIYKLNHAAARLWELLHEGHDVASAKERLLEEYDASTERIDADVATTLEALAKARFLTLGSER